MSESARKPWVLRTILRVAISAVVLGWLLHIVNVDALEAVLRRASPPLLAAALAAYVCDEALATWKWKKLLQWVSVERGFGALFRLTLEGRFIAFFLPSTATADLYKGAVLARGGGKSTAAFSSILLDRILGLLSVATIGLVAVGSLPAAVAGAPSGVSVLAAVAVTAAGLAAFLHADRFASATVPYLPEKWTRVRAFLHDLAEALAVYRRNQALLVQTFVISLLVQGARALAVWVLARAVGDATPFVFFVLLVPYVNLVNLLPIASGRLGLEQAVFVQLFAAVGMPRDTALAISLLSVAVEFVLVLPFAIGLLFRRKAPHAQGAASNEDLSAQGREIADVRAAYPTWPRTSPARDASAV